MAKFNKLVVDASIISLDWYVVISVGLSTVSIYVWCMSINVQSSLNAGSATG